MKDQAIYQALNYKVNRNKLASEAIISANEHYEERVNKAKNQQMLKAKDITEKIREREQRIEMKK